MRLSQTLPKGTVSHRTPFSGGNAAPRRVQKLHPARPPPAAFSQRRTFAPTVPMCCMTPQDGPTLPEPQGSNDLPSQGDMITRGTGLEVQLLEKDDKKKGFADLDYLAELIAIQNNGPKAIGFFGTRNMGYMHQQLVEVLSYAMVLTDNHVFTSGATGTNAAVIRGALRAEKPDLLTVVLPQSLDKQPPESQELLSQVQNVITMPQNDDMRLLEASRVCNKDIVERVQQVVCFAFHDSRLLLETCDEAREMRKLVTLFFLD